MRTIIPALAIVFAATTIGSAQSLTGQRQTVTVAPGDTLWSLGARFGIEPATIARDNDRALDAALAVGETLTLDNRHIVPVVAPGTALVVNVPQRMLFHFAKDEVTGYAVAVGRPGWPTPPGAFSIVSKEVNPTWDVPASIREEARRAGRSLPRKIPPGPGNPLGAYWMGLSVGSLGIHGTNSPGSVYRAVTHGCIRLRPDDIAALFVKVQLGTTGTVVYEPVLVAVDGYDVFMEAHPDIYHRGPADALAFARDRARALGVFDSVDWTVAGQVIGARAGAARVVTR